MKMAGNKHNTEFTRLNVKKVEMRYTGLYGDSTLFQGSPKQAIKHLIDLL